MHVLHYELMLKLVLFKGEPKPMGEIDGLNYFLKRMKKILKWIDVER